MIIQEIKRGFSRRVFWIVCLVALLICIIAGISVSTYSSNNEILEYYMKAYVFTAYDGFILFKMSKIGSLYILIMPILSSLCYSDTYWEDINSGMIKFIYTREKKIKFLISKYLANFIISGIAVSTPLLVNYLILILRIPSIEPNSILGVNTITSTQLLPDLFYNNPNLYILMWIGIIFIFSGIFASIGLASSIVLKNKIAIILLPFITCNVFGIILQILDKHRYYPIYFLYLGVYQNLSIILWEALILIIISFGIFILGGKYSETF